MVNPPADNSVSLTTEFPSYGPGAEVVIRLTNSSSGEVGYNLCASELQRLEDETWLRAPGADWVCTMELRLLDRGGVASFPHRLPANLPSGQYRFTTAVENMQSGARYGVSSNTFAVTQQGP